MIHFSQTSFISIFFVVECDSLPEIDSGFIQISSNGTLTKAVYSCINGYHIFGESEIHCLTDGKWSSPMPSCGNTFTFGTPSYWSQIFLVFSVYILRLIIMDKIVFQILQSSLNHKCTYTGSVQSLLILSNE